MIPNAALLAALAIVFALPPASAATLTATRTSAFEYDATTGLITAEVIEPDNPQNCVRTTYAYTDANQTVNYGNKLAATTSNCAGASGRAVFTTRSSATAFASQTVVINGVPAPIPAGTYATSAANALNQSETHQLDPRFGAMTQLTGPNGLSTNWQIDDFGRKVRETRADGTGTLNDYCYLSVAIVDTSANTANCVAGTPAEAPVGAVMYMQSVSLNTAGAANSAWTRVYYDRLGRTMRGVTQSFDGNSQASRLIVKDTIYNAQGAVVEVTQPYFIDTGSSLSAGNASRGATTTVYDVLGRPTQTLSTDPVGSQPSVVFPDGSTRTAARMTYAYAGLATTLTNDKGQTQTSEKNAGGQVVRTTDGTGAQLASLFDPFGNLLKTLDPLGNSVAMAYDIRGRKTSMADPDSGLWQYDYDALGELVWQQNPTQRAAGQTTTLAYDPLGRLTQRSEPEYISTWSYDRYADASACTQGIGKLCEVVTSNGTRRKAVYDALGRPVSTQLLITNGPSYTSGVAYDAANGRIVTQTYPTGVAVTYSYTALGYMERLANGATNATLWQAQASNAWGSIDTQRAGNGIQTRQLFDAQTGRIAEIDADPGNGSNAVLRHRYSYDAINNLAARIDDNGAGNGQAVSESFNYDAINRLIQYQVAGPAITGLARSVTLHYNALGAMLDKTDVGVYRYPASGTNSVAPHAVAAINATAYSYDANGNLISATGGKYRSITWTSFNLPDSQSGAAGPGNNPRYTWQYDADHQRVKETHVDASGTRTTWTVHPDNAGSLSYENEIAADGSQTNRHYLTAGGIGIGILVTNGDPHSGTAATIVKTEYWHRDHLGSIAVTTDATGAVTHRYAYDPFGKRRPPDGNYDSLGTIIGDYPNGTDRGFTGHEHLDDLGIVHMNGRLYDPNTGRFLQADPYIQSPGNLQSYQRYAYILNNPLNGTDPSGMFSIKGHFINVLTGNLSGLNADGRAALHNPYVRIAAAIAVAYFTGYADYGSYGVGVFGASANAGVAATSWAGFANAAAAGFAGGYVATGTLKGGLNGLYTGVLFFGAGSIGAQLGAGFASGQAGAVGLHAVAGCLSSEISGGECKDGALSAAFSEAATNFIEGDRFQKVVLHAVVGGTASAIGGGKFTNGAFTGAFGYIFNECGHTDACGRGSRNGDSYSRSLQYPDNFLAIDPNTGTTYPIPNNFDIDKNIEFGESKPNKFQLFEQLAPGRSMDYQRPGGYWSADLNNNISLQYVNLGNYNYGVVLGASGYSLADTIEWAQRARFMTKGSYGIGQRETNNITQGWQDYTSGHWKKPGG